MRDNRREAGRKPDFYWVMGQSGVWTVARWSTFGYWLFIGNEEGYHDSDLLDIDERPILREEK